MGTSCTIRVVNFEAKMTCTPGATYFEPLLSEALVHFTKLIETYDNTKTME